jgi:hypothetical protein
MYFCNLHHRSSEDMGEQSKVAYGFLIEGMDNEFAREVRNVEDDHEKKSTRDDDFVLKPKLSDSLDTIVSIPDGRVSKVYSILSIFTIFLFTRNTIFYTIHFIQYAPYNIIHIQCSSYYTFHYNKNVP